MTILTILYSKSLCKLDNGFSEIQHLVCNSLKHLFGLLADCSMENTYGTKK